MQLTNEGKELLGRLFSSIWKYSLIVIVTLFIVYNCHGCEHKEQSITVSNKVDIAKIDSLNLVSKAKNDTILLQKKQLVILDSISKIKKKNYTKAKTDNRNYIANNPCDNVGILKAYDNTVAKCDTVIIRDSLAIKTLISINKDYQSVLSDKKSMLQLKEKQLEQQNIDLGIAKKEVKVQKRNKIIAFGLAILAVIVSIVKK